MLDQKRLIDRLPLAAKGFRKIIRQGLFYVDKTALVYEIARNSHPKFLSRPRRFGKSTLVSTLEELFVHGVKAHDGVESCFKGLAMEKLWQDNGTYHVLHLNFRLLDRNAHGAESFKGNFAKALDDFALQCGITLREQDITAADKFLYVLSKLPDYSVVLLADEYDAPLTRCMQSGSKQDVDEIVKTLQDFYAVVKDLDDRFRCVFITGITRYKDTYLFTAGNSITDISQQRLFGTVCGYTREEIKHTFGELLSLAAMTHYGLSLQEALREEAKERMLDELALWYDGYCFDEEGATSVFSTWSVLQFFASASNLFDVYWYDAAGMPAVIRNKFRKCDYVQMLEELNVGKPITVTRDVFINPSSLDSMEPHVLLFQTGYLTLAEGYKGVHLLSPTVKLDYPNTEIRKAFSDMLHDVFLPEGVLGDRYRNGNGRANPEFVAALQRRDLDTVMNIINGYFRTVDYEGETINKEVTATAFMSFFIRDLLAQLPLSNRHQSTGKPDLAFDYGQLRIIIENKFVSKEEGASEEKIAAALKKAQEQIKERHYGETVDTAEPCRLQLWRIATVYSARKRELVSWADADG